MGLRCFLSEPTKKFSPKLRENWREKLDIIFGQKCPCAVARGLVHVALLFFFFFLFLFLSSYTLSLINFFFSFFGRLPTHPCSYSFFFFCLDVFFFRHDFYFLINLGDWFFFVVYPFLVLIGHNFLTRIYA